MIKKFLRIFLIVSLIAVSCLGLLAGCGEEETLSFWAYEPSDQEKIDGYREMIADFTKDTGIAVKINFVEKDNYKKSLNSALGSKKKPDLAYLDQPMIADYAVDGTLMDMTDMFSGSEIYKQSRFFDGAYATTLYNNRNYGVPLTLTTSVLFYNKALMPGGASAPQLPTNWDEWKNTAVPTGKALFEGIGAGGYSSWYFQVFLENAGGKFVNEANTAVAFNNDAGQAAAQFIKDLYAKSPKAIRDTTDAFGRGNVVYKLGSSSDIEKFKNAYGTLNFGVMTIPPMLADGESKSNIGGENLVIIEKSKKKEDAKKLMEYLLKKENVQKIAHYTGNFAAIKEYATTDDANKQAVLDQLETAQARPSVPKWIQVNDDYLSAALESILSDTNPGNIKEKLDFAASQANNLLFK